MNKSERNERVRRASNLPSSPQGLLSDAEIKAWPEKRTMAGGLNIKRNLLGFFGRKDVYSEGEIISQLRKLKVISDEEDGRKVLEDFCPEGIAITYRVGFFDKQLELVRLCDTSSNDVSRSSVKYEVRARFVGNPGLAYACGC